MYDLAVIGGGPGGYVAAIRGAQEGLKTILIEKDSFGGTCLNRGCIPTKSFIYDSKLLEKAQNSEVLTGTGSLAIDGAKLLARKQKVVARLVGGLGAIIKSNGIETVQGLGSLEGPGKVRVSKADGSSQLVEARNVLLATGSRPSFPPFIDIDGEHVQTTDEALNSDTIPKDVLIIGGGVIGVEMATIYLNLGAQVTIVEMLPDILMTEDKDVRDSLLKLLKQRGAKIHLNASVKAIAREGDTVQSLFADSEGAEHKVQTERVLVATGRGPVLDGIDVEKLGLQMEGPYVKINSSCMTNLPNVYAIGDLVGGMMLAHKASAEAEVAVEHMLGQQRTLNPRFIPRCIWGVTEVGAVGLTEEEAKAAGYSIKVGKFPYANSGAAQAMGDDHGFAKIVGDATTGEILGVHIVGEHATDLISEAVTTMKMEGAVEDLFQAVKPHPTVSEVVLEAALDWSGIAIHAPRRRE
ncbi:dihydrolipoyl dehydrogenase [Desulfopila sp. IMCC35008]|uniref:dihydrolipoyl dehydrogenase n=1 Tax=Desulfopila sp. IMCC35008 TaxID=2653858 RepID=UPI0013D69729|nr:dihydrolipoyl dehydrogenase [Desulfopila sp. IMCC35008]